MRRYAMVAEYYEYFSTTLVRETFTKEATNVREAIDAVQDYIMKNRNVKHRNIMRLREDKDRDIVITNIYSEEV